MRVWGIIAKSEYCDMLLFGVIEKLNSFGAPALQKSA